MEPRPARRPTPSMRPRQRARLTATPLLVAFALLALAALGAPARTAMPSLRQQPAVSERVHVWWNEDLARILHIEGLWSTSTAGEFVRMRPERDLDCRIELLEVLTGEVHSYALDRSGEVVLAHGWIMINQRDRLTLGGAGTDFGPACDPSKDVGTPIQLKSAVTWIEWNAGAWDRDLSVLEPTPTRRNESMLSLVLADAPASGAHVRYQFRNGRIERSPKLHDAAGGDLRFRQVRYPATGTVELLFCE